MKKDAIEAAKEKRYREPGAWEKVVRRTGKAITQTLAMTGLLIIYAIVSLVLGRRGDPTENQTRRKK